MSKQHFIDALTTWDAARDRAKSAEQQLSNVIRALYGHKGVTHGHRELRPTVTGLVSEIHVKDSNLCRCCSNKADESGLCESCRSGGLL